MTKKPARSNMRWTEGEKKKLRELNKKGETTEKIASDLERSESAVRSKASDLKISLLPKD
jgi:hypothetical protein